MGKKKIKELFEYRKLPSMLKYHPKKSRKPLYKGMIKLQMAIYDLDHYLETNWKLKNKKLKFHWESIYKELKKLGINEADYEEYCSHIKKYELHESQLRSGLMPTRLSSEYYYYYKSCDVRLMRKILIAKNEKLANAQTLSDWRYFDLVTEINDDVDDVFEDHETINGNMFLIMLYEDGIDKTARAFKAMLRELKKKSSKRAHKTDIQKKIHGWTLESIVDTEKLLDKRIGKIKAKGLKLKKLELCKYIEF